MRRSGRHAASARLGAAEKKKKKDRLGYTIIGISAGVVALLVVLGLTVFSQVRIDRRTGCPIDRRPPAAHTFVLVDETDALSRDELAYAKAVIINEYYWLPIGGRLTVRNIVADLNMAEDIVVCRMDDGSGSLGLYDNPRMVRHAFDNIAGSRLEELYSALRTAQVQEYSPLFEYAAAVMDRANFGSNVEDRRLVLISDMAQHSDLFSHYGRNAAVRPSPAVINQVRRDMSGVHVRIHYVQRRELARLQSDHHRQFWLGHFRGMGSDVALGHNLLIGEESDRETWSDDG